MCSQPSFVTVTVAVRSPTSPICIYLVRKLMLVLVNRVDAGEQHTISIFEFRSDMSIVSIQHACIHNQ